MIAAFLKPFAGIIGAVLVVLICLGGPAVWWWDRRPAHTPSFHVLFFRWTAPDSLKAKGERALADLSTCHANTATLSKAIASQNASLAAQSRLGAAALAKSETAIQQAQAKLATANQARVQIMAPLKADETCARAREVDGRLLGSLK